MIKPQIISELMAALKEEHAAHLAKNINPYAIPCQCAPTGSRVICNPPVMNTDDDWLVFVSEHLCERAIAFLEDAGATHSEEQETYPDGVCYRYGDVNPILIWDYDVFYMWVATTYFAAKLNLTSKEERTAIFAALVDKSTPIEKLVLGTDAMVRCE